MADKTHKAIFNDIFYGRIENVSEAVHNNKDLATTVFIPRTTLLIEVCNGPIDALELVELLVSLGTNIHARNSINNNPLTCAAWRGHIKICSFLLDYGVYSESSYFKAFRNACNNGHLQVCLLLILRCMKHIVMDIDSRNELNRYGISLYPRLSSDEENKDREILLKVFNIEERWVLRWPMMNVMTGCGFRPLAEKLLELKRQRDALLKRGELPPPIVLDTPERRRAYYMGMVFGNDGLLRLIVLFL